MNSQLSDHFLIVVNKCDIYSLKCTRIRLAAGLRPDPLGELKRSPGPGLL